MADEQRIRLRVDAAESTSFIPSLLSAMPDVDVEMVRLDVGDYELSDRVVVERKTAADFVASIIDRRLMSQAADLVGAYERPIVLVEGDLATVPSKMDPEAIRGMISYLSVVLGITVIPTRSPKVTAQMLRRMAMHAQHGLGYDVPLRGSKPDQPSVLAQYLVEGLPMVGATRARVLLERFGSPRAVFTAPADALRAVPGLGPKAVAAIQAALDAPVAAVAAPMADAPDELLRAAASVPRATATATATAAVSGLAESRPV